MTQQKIIRHVATLDRPEFRVTAEEVFESLKAMHEECKATAFTTCDIAARLAEKFRGISHERIERSVRVAVFWLCEREVAYVAGHTVKTTAAGCVSKPFTYALHPGRAWNKQRREVVMADVDHMLLTRVLCCR